MCAEQFEGVSGYFVCVCAEFDSFVCHTNQVRSGSHLLKIEIKMSNRVRLCMEQQGQ